jgi:hypothetical protein
MEAANNGSRCDSVWTGETDPKLVQQMAAFQGNSTINLCFDQKCPPHDFVQPWATASANQVRGSSGKQYVMHQDAGGDGNNGHPVDRLTLFHGYLLRAATLVRAAVVDLYGVTVHRFVVDDATFANVTENPDNSAYYSFGPRGLANMSAAISNAPFLMSKPHFLDADPSLAEAIQGLAPPVRERDEAYFDIEPYTGSVLAGAMRVQVNMDIGRVVFTDDKRSTVYPNATRVVLPLFWFDEGGGIDAKTGQLFVNTVYLAQTVATWAFWCGLLMGFALVSLGAYYYCQDKPVLAVRSRAASRAMLPPGPPRGF